MYSKILLSLAGAFLFVQTAAARGTDSIPEFRADGFYPTLKKIELGIKFGGGLAYQSYKGPEILSSETINTLNAVVSVSLPLKNSLFIRSGIGVGGRGGVIIEDALTTSTRVTYLQLPLHIADRFTLRQLGSLYIGLGGYASTGISGRLRYQTPNSEVSDKLAFGKGNDLLKRDAGASVIAGLELDNNLTFNISYELGLMNIASSPLKNAGVSGIYNRYLGVSLGYRFK